MFGNYSAPIWAWVVTMSIKYQIYERGTIQRISESLYKGDFGKYDKGWYTTKVPEPYASMYCQQFDDFKNVADFLEFAAKLMRRQ